MLTASKEEIRSAETNSRWWQLFLSCVWFCVHGTSAARPGGTLQVCWLRILIRHGSEFC